MEKKTRCMLGALMVLLTIGAGPVLPVLADDPVIYMPTCPARQIVPQRLADLNIPRANHSVFFAGGKLVVAGGHTSGFVVTPTAEYLSSGEWQVVPMAYTHDAGFSVVMKSGRVLIGGGYEKDLGIGQIFSVEWYDPEAHSFEGFGSLDSKRAQAQGLELDSGQVLVSGNWYHDDSMELFDGQKYFTLVDSVTHQRCMPYLFRSAKDNAMVLGGWDTKFRPLDYPTTVDRLKGGPVDIPLLSSWMPLPCPAEHRPQDSFIGDEEREIYAYLMAVCDLSGTKAITLVRNGEIEQLPTDYSIPTEWEDTTLDYFSTVIVDRRSGCGYMAAMDQKGRIMILCIDYADAIDGDCRLTGQPAKLALLYTDVLGPRADWPGHTTPVLTPDGDLVLVGGAIDDNFAPNRAVWLFPVGDGDHTALTGGLIPWSWLLGGLVVSLLLAVVGGGYWIVRCRRPKTGAAAASTATATMAMTANQELMQRICKLMEQEQLYLKSGLKVSDIAATLGTNSNYVTNCINSLRGCSFSQFVNRYRIDYAQQMMRNHPDMKMTEVWIASGFANETSFFRTFRAVVGATPKEWMQSLDETK